MLKKARKTVNHVWHERRKEATVWKSASGEGQRNRAEDEGADQ